ncbi:hypothetical protein HMPREF9548_02056 [Escherichia coli MS 182-1]|nr:hypothetical protein HMPREF9548_02056 [Escherichia coli MS 182-1]KEM68397.1 hypothetical protein AD47_2170 [Escherichia coli 6-319-05_S4_C3]
MRNGNNYRKNSNKDLLLSMVMVLLIHLNNILAPNSIIPFLISVS